MSRSLRLVALPTVLNVFAPHAAAQEADIIGPLTNAVRCIGPNAREDLDFNMKKLGAPSETVVAALRIVAADEARCAPLREAAAELVLVYTAQPVPTTADLEAASARQSVEQTLAEADRKAASLKFTVNPPPPRMTKERVDGARGD
jgi:hypothetical protein